MTVVKKRRVLTEDRFPCAGAMDNLTTGQNLANLCAMASCLEENHCGCHVSGDERSGSTLPDRYSSNFISFFVHHRHCLLRIVGII
jgi:hypothetical protein